MIIFKNTRIIVRRMGSAHKPIAELFSALSHPARILILGLLREKELSVTELIEKTKLPQANVSQHLSLMRSARIVSTRRTGKSISYRISSEKVGTLIDTALSMLKDRLKQEADSLK